MPDCAPAELSLLAGSRWARMPLTMPACCALPISLRFFTAGLCMASPEVPFCIARRPSDGPSAAC